MADDDVARRLHGRSELEVAKGNTAEEIATLKQRPGKDLALFGSANLASSLMQLGLIDEIRIFINPLVLGCGNPTFKDVKDRMALKLVKARTFRSGNVLLYYQPESGTPLTR